MIDRYSLPEMAAFFTPKAEWRAALHVELTVLAARVAKGEVPAADLTIIMNALADDITPEIVARIRAREEVTDHDVAAFVDVMAEIIDHPAAQWFHQGLTSSDVTDTALCMRLRDASQLVHAELIALIRTLSGMALEYAVTPTAGRTHGQHAEIITFGARLTVWAQGLMRAESTLEDAINGISVGKLSGACGTYSNIDPEVESQALSELDLRPITATQVVPRDLHATLLRALADMATAVETVFDNLRIMATTEFGEVEEGRRIGQKGSSAMPHKRNPIKSEQFVGLARLIRHYAAAAQDNVVLLFERDISHSAPERIYFPDCLGLSYYLVVTARRVLSKLVVNTERMQANIDLTCGVMYSATLLSALIDKGWWRDDAYREVQMLCSQAYDSKIQLRELAGARSDFGFTAKELDHIFDQERLTANCHLITDQMSWATLSP